MGWEKWHIKVDRAIVNVKRMYLMSAYNRVKKEQGTFARILAPEIINTQLKIYKRKKRIYN